MRILVTGGAGFIGSHLCERLVADGHDVIAFDRFDDTLYDPALKEASIAGLLPSDRFELVRADMLDEQALAGVFERAPLDGVIHLAALAGVRPSITNPLPYMRVNVEGTARLLELCRQHAVARICFASSSSVYGRVTDPPSTEDDPVDAPLSPYAASKRAGELLCRTWHEAHGLNIACVRYFTVYGPRQRPGMAIRNFCEALLAGETLHVNGDGSMRRSYTYVADAVDGTVRALFGTEGFRIYNIGSTRTVSLTELVEICGRAANVTPQLEYHPVPVGDVPLTCADVSRANAELGWAPVTTIEDGVRQVLLSLRDDETVTLGDQNLTPPAGRTV